MNPWAAFVIVIALAIIIVGVKGKEDNLIAAIIGKQYGSSTLK